jgi:hypothetical protein
LAGALTDEAFERHEEMEPEDKGQQKLAEKVSASMSKSTQGEVVDKKKKRVRFASQLEVRHYDGM